MGYCLLIGITRTIDLEGGLPIGVVGTIYSGDGLLIGIVRTTRFLVCPLIGTVWTIGYGELELSELLTSLRALSIDGTCLDNRARSPVLHCPRKKSKKAIFRKIHDWKHLYLRLFTYGVP